MYTKQLQCFIGDMVNCQDKENGFLYTFYAGEN